MEKIVYLLCMIGFEDSYIHQALYGVFDKAENLVKAYMELYKNDVRLYTDNYFLDVYAVPLGEFIYYKKTDIDNVTTYEEDITGRHKIDIKDVVDIFYKDLEAKYGEDLENSEHLTDFERSVLEEFGFFDAIWKPFSDLREVDESLSGYAYSGKYAQNNKMFRRCYGKGGNKNYLTYKEIAEPVEIKIDKNGELKYRVVYDFKASLEQPAEYNTQYGTFISNNQGEFGGDMMLPNGNKVNGNYVDVFECGDYVYAVSSLAHFFARDFVLDCFDKALVEKTVYSSYSSGSLTGILFKYLDSENDTYESMGYGARCVDGDALYIVISGRIEHNDSENEACTKILVIKDGEIQRIVSLPMILDRINEMVVHQNIAYVAMDKMIAAVNLEDETVRWYTVVNEEEEADLRATSATMVADDEI